VNILTRRGNDWSEKYPAVAEAIARLPAHNAYLDGELCGVLPDGRTAFNLIQNASDTGEGSLVFFLFDLLFLDGESLVALPLVERKARLASLLSSAPERLQYNDHQIGQGPAFHRLACEHGLEPRAGNALTPPSGPGGRLLTFREAPCQLGARIEPRALNIAVRLMARLLRPARDWRTSESLRDYYPGTRNNTAPSAISTPGLSMMLILAASIPWGCKNLGGL
jgi:hypothetical protein